MPHMDLAGPGRAGFDLFPGEKPGAARAIDPNGLGHAPALLGNRWAIRSILGRAMRR